MRYLQGLTLIFTLLFSLPVYPKVPLFTEYPGVEFKDWKLQRSYRVASLFFPEEGEEAIDNAIEAWNTASGNPTFMRHVSPKDTSANIYIVPSYYLTLLEPLGVAHFFNAHLCSIQVSIQAYNDAEVYAHELGHCLGFAHNKEDRASIMHPSAMHGTPRVDENTAQALREMLNTLTRRKSWNS